MGNTSTIKKGPKQIFTTDNDDVDRKKMYPAQPEDINLPDDDDIKSSSTSESGLDHEDEFKQEQNQPSTSLLFVPTKQYVKLQKRLDESHFAILTGLPGDGKSFAALNYMKSLQKQKKGGKCKNAIMTPVIINQMFDISKLKIGTMEFQVLIVDRLFDHIKFDTFFQELIDSLKDVLIDSMRSLRTQIIIVMQKEVKNFLQIQYPSYWIKEENVIDFSEELSVVEKSKILESHISGMKNTNCIVSSKRKIFGFPECCRLFTSLSPVTSDLFFHQSVQVLKNHFSKMDGRCLFVLGMMLMNDGTLTETKILRSPELFPFSESLAIICGISIDTISVSTFLTIARSFVDVYFLKQSDSFKFRESQISDAITHVLFQRNPLKFIESCPVYLLVKCTSENFLKENNFHMGSMISKTVHRYCLELQTRPSKDLFESIWQSEIFSSKSFSDHFNKSLAVNINALEPYLRTMFFNCMRDDKVHLITYLLIHFPLLSYKKKDRKKYLTFLKSHTIEDGKLLLRGECAYETYGIDNRDIKVFNTLDLLSSTERNLEKNIYVFNESIISFETESSSAQLSLDLGGLHKINSCKSFLHCSHTFENCSKGLNWKTLSHVSFQCLRCKEKPSVPFLKQLLEKGLEKQCSDLIKIAMAFVKKDSFWWLKESLERVIERGDIKSTKMLLSEVAQCFRRLYLQNSVVHHIWFGRQKNFQIPYIVDSIVCVVGASKPKLDTKDFLGLCIVLRTDNEFNDEEKQLITYETKNKTYCPIKIKSATVESLFAAHTNITMIRASTACFFGDVHKSIERIPCIAIFCHVKGIIPVGENEFPICLDHYKVDVREGSCLFAGKPLQIGQKIESNDKYGTLSGFVHINAKRKGFLTCAHVVLDNKTLRRGNVEETIKHREINICDRTSIVQEKRTVGVLYDAAFSHNDPSSVSVDAAVIEIKNGNPENGRFCSSFDIPQQFINAGFSKESELEFENGETEKITEDNFHKPVIKIGASSGLTIGSINTGEVVAFRIDDQAEIINTKDTLMDNKSFSFKMYKQIEILPQDEKFPFLEKGDSGAFIFMITNRKPLVLKCIGMAVAVTSYGSCLMTPIADVLEALGLSPDSLLKFPRTVTDPSLDSATLETLRNFLMPEIKNLLTDELGKAMATLATKEDVRGIDQRLKALEKSAKK